MFWDQEASGSNLGTPTIFSGATAHADAETRLSRHYAVIEAPQRTSDSPPRNLRINLRIHVGEARRRARDTEEVGNLSCPAHRAWSRGTS